MTHTETDGEYETERTQSAANILIVGWNKSTNYGTCLQALALYDAVSARYDCSMMWERKRMNLGAVVRHFAVRRKPNDAVDELKRIRTETCFAYVDKTYLNSRREMTAARKKFSVFLVGGDQLWNPSFIEKTYLLDFVPSGARKASYATSIGMTDIPKNAARTYKKYLRRFDVLCMRDFAGALSMEKITGKTVQTVADPVFLTVRENWTEFAKSAVDFGVNFDYALMYFVGERDGRGEYNRRRAADLAAKRGLKVILIPMDATDYADGASLSGVGPREFVKLVAGAKYVYTDSYHMSALSIIFGKAFFVFKRFDEDKEYNLNSRVDELLATFGEDGGADAEILPRAEWADIIEKMRARSLDALYNSIKT